MTKTSDRPNSVRHHAAVPPPASFAEKALKLGGKGEEEVRRTGAVDAVDEQMENLFGAGYQTVDSPIHRAVWGRTVPYDLFSFTPDPVSPKADMVMRDSLEVVHRHVDAGTLLDDKSKIHERVFEDLADAGYWGLLVSKEYGGSDVPFAQFASFLTEMATVDPTVAGLASVHGCIGAVDPVQAFGNDRQKQYFLPKLASGERLSGFALTEPGAGSDLTALKTTARLDGDEYVLNGEKLFITNALPGRTLGLVCLIKDCPAVLVIDLPDAEDEHFRLKSYRLHALRHAHNYGLVFRDFRVPAATRLQPAKGDGLTIAYHGLNRGRLALCAIAAGTMRTMLADMLPWARFRHTYGAPIATRELVRRRIAHLAGLIVACDAVVQWGAALLDLGYRGEMECIVAKILGSESQKEAAIELYMKTHGGRAFLEGHLFGDNVHEFLAPCIYEGEVEMLGMAFFKTLVKHHAQQYFEPVGTTLAAVGVSRPNMLNPSHLWLLRGPLCSYLKWLTNRKMRFRRNVDLPPMPPALQRHAEFATDFLQHTSLEISATMRKHQLKLADRQCRMAEISGRVQLAATILCTSLYATQQTDEIVRQAADCICQEFTRTLTGKRPSDSYFRSLNTLAETILDGRFPPLAGVSSRPILMPYQ